MTSLTIDMFVKKPLTRKNAIKMYLTVCDRCIPENICVNKSILTLVGN